MKYLITESQRDNIIFRYLDNQDFIQIEKDNSIYFINSDNDEYAQIRYDTVWCLISIDLIKEISSFFSLEEDYSKEVITKWVEDTLQVKITHTSSSLYNDDWELGEFSN